LRERAVWSRPATGADQLAQARLHVQVDVLELLAEREGPAASSPRSLQAGLDRGAVLAEMIP
jgi:hypothetical protein